MISLISWTWPLKMRSAMSGELSRISTAATRPLGVRQGQEQLRQVGYAGAIELGLADVLACKPPHLQVPSSPTRPVSASAKPRIPPGGNRARVAG